MARRLSIQKGKTVFICNPALRFAIRREKNAGFNTSSDVLSVASCGSSAVSSQLAKPDALFAAHTLRSVDASDVADEHRLALLNGDVAQHAAFVGGATLKQSRASDERAQAYEERKWRVISRVRARRRKDPNSFPTEDLSDEVLKSPPFSRRIAGASRRGLRIAPPAKANL